MDNCCRMCGGPKESNRPFFCSSSCVQRYNHKFGAVGRTRKLVIPKGPRRVKGAEFNTPEVFWSRVDKGIDCWVWTAKSRNSGGYGSFRYKGKQRSTHRIAYELTFGPIPAGMCVLHRCDNPPCCNPAHLFLGTVADNSADMVSKGRQATGVSVSRRDMSTARRGSKHPDAKLTEASVREIRQRHESGESYYKLAERYGVQFGTIGKIVRREAWKHVA